LARQCPIATQPWPKEDEADPEDRHIPPMQLRRIYEAMPARWRALLRVLELTRLRLGELQGLQVQDVDTRQRRLRVRDNALRRLQHGGTRRDQPVPQEAVRLLRAIQSPNARSPGAAFVSEELRDADAAHKVWKRACVAAGAVKAVTGGLPRRPGDACPPDP
jgi:integrase